MGGLVDIAASILARSEKRVETSANNIANVTTTGFKRRIEFSDVLGAATSGDLQRQQQVTDFTAGKPINTGNPNDLTLLGEGFFAVSSPDGTFYTRQGQFKRDGEGRLVTAQGFALQLRGGGDLVLKGNDFAVAADGTVSEAGQPVGKLAIVDFERRAAMVRSENGLFAAPEGEAVDVETPSVRQGMLEASNVSTGDEMVMIMEALRRAETGQRIVNVYDDLMGRALTAFGTN
jgi:flagellar basal-body rod protein FlgG